MGNELPIEAGEGKVIQIAPVSSPRQIYEGNMSVRIIKFDGGRELLAVKRIKIHFVSGNVMVGDINIHSKLIEEGDENIYLRTSDYIKQCKKEGEPLTVFNAKYQEAENMTFFVLLDTVECICEEE